MPEESKKTVSRRVLKKKCFVCVAVPQGTPLDQASTFKAIMQVPDTNAAVAYVKETRPDGEYVLMYEGRRITKMSKTISTVVLSPEV